MYFLEFQWLSSVESACSAEDARDPGSIPGPERYLRGGNGNPLQYCLKIPVDRVAWHATVHGVAERWTLLSD